jgi:ubiquinone/menaquinone biosynthesis C-methylase UbiE
MLMKKNNKTGFLRTFLYILITLIIIAASNYSCFSVSNKKREEMIKDSSNIYSTHPNKPFKYGFALSKEQNDYYYKEDISFYKLKKGDVVAEIGAASGWRCGIISLYTDSITFYVEDIDTSYLDQLELNKVVEYFSKLKNGPQTNSFKYVMGTEKSTCLPDSTFDVILFINAYHEIYDIFKILKDLKRIVKPNSKIIVNDEWSNEFMRIRHPGCNYIAEKVKWTTLFFNEIGFHLTESYSPLNSFDNILIFEQDSIKAEIFSAKRDSISYILMELDKLYNKDIARDSNQTKKIANYLKENLTTLTKIHPMLFDPLAELANQYCKKKEKEAALNVAFVNLFIYPENSNSFEEIAETYLDFDDLKNAEIFLKKAIQIDPKNEFAKETLIEVQTYLNNPEQKK